MSGTTSQIVTSGYLISTAPAGGQAQDTDGLLNVQIDFSQNPPMKKFVKTDPRTLLSSYAVPGAKLMGPGPGASRGLAGAAVPTEGDPFVGYGLHSSLAIAQASSGAMSVLQVVSGLPNTPVGLDANSNASVPGNTISLGIANDFSIGRDPETGHAVLNILIPDTEDGFIPIPGTRHLYSDGGTLRIAR